MPRVRWRVFVFAASFIQLWTISHSEHMQNVISMTDDGWRPIVGTGRQSVAPTNIQSKKYSPGSNLNIEIAKSTSIVLPSTFPTPKPNKFNGQNVNVIKNEPVQHQNNGRKKPPHTKPSSQDYYTIQAIPSKSLSPPHLAQRAPPRTQPPKKPNAVIKPGPQFHNSQRKPPRGPSASHNEPFFQASASGVFPIVKSPSAIKTRETPLGLIGSGHFSLHQPHGHIEFNRYLSPPNNDAFQQIKSQPLFIFSQPPSGDFKKQNDEFTRHLVPPPPGKHNGQQVQFVDSVQAISQNAFQLQNAASNHFGIRAPQVQDNLIIQNSEGFDFQNKLKGEHASDVQVTKESFKDFHANLPGIRNRPVPEYMDFNFHTISTPGEFPKLQTYEVTEGRWVDNPNSFSFSLPNKQQKLQTTPQPPPLRRPQIIQEPIVELSLPPFLPTPYKPDPAIPTSETQKESSTIFTKVSSKLNKYKEEALANSPLLFNVKEVSTHYPILGQPAFQSIHTGLGVDNEAVSNNVSSPSPSPETPTTQKPKMRRKPKPRRPVTTTTEEPTTDSSDLQKLSESVEEQTERPRKRQRVRTHHRTTTEATEEPVTYRTTTLRSNSEEGSTERTRGRNRYRQRGNYVTNEITTRRGFLRPKLTNHKSTDSDTGLIEHKYREQYTEQPEYKDETTTLRTFNRFGDSFRRVPEEIDVRPDEPTTLRTFNRFGDSFRRVPEEIDIRPESSFVNNEIHTARPDIEETTFKIPESDEISIPTSENITPETVILTSAPLTEVILTTPAVSENIEEYATTSTTTTTTQITTTTTSKPVKNRTKLKYNSSNRPRFSVKEYRQRLNQYTSTTPSTTTDFVKTAEGIKLRFPSRLRPRTTVSTTTQSYSPVEDEENTEPLIRRRFRPKEPRHGTTSTTENSEQNSALENNDKIGRPRPVNRKSDVKSKVSIRPNLFSAKRRPPPSIRSKYNKTSEDVTTTELVETTQVPTEVPSESQKLVEVSGASNDVPFMETHKTDALQITSEEITTESVSDDDYSKRVSDLTSAFHSKYDTPGFFKSVPSNSRRIPNHFTISTEDPILPIEAFFPNLKDKE